MRGSGLCLAAARAFARGDCGFGELDTVEIAAGAVEREGPGEEEPSDASEGALDGGARCEWTEAEGAAAIHGAAVAAVDLAGATDCRAMSSAEDRAGDCDGAAGSSVEMEVAAETRSCHACTLPRGYVDVALNQWLAASSL